MTSTLSFRERLRNRELLVGTFLKTPAHQLVEVLGGSGIDFIVIDAEHAAFDRAALDVCLLAARAGNLAALVRLQSPQAPQILDALDLGATGIVAAHALSAQGVREVDAAARYRDGRRGFSNSPRAGNYGAVSMPEHIARADRDSVVICQIEDREAVDNIDAIVAQQQADCLFIGRADLAVSYGVPGTADPQVTRAVLAVCAAARGAGKAVGIHLAHADEIPAWTEQGVSLFVIGSDQSLLRAAAGALRRHAPA